MPGRNWNNFFLGLFIALLPFLGFPSGPRTALFVLAGLLVAIFSLARLGPPAATGS